MLGDLLHDDGIVLTFLGFLAVVFARAPPPVRVAVAVLVVVFAIWFHRHPAAPPPPADARAVVSPAYGTVAAVRATGRGTTVVVIGLSVLDVHVQYAPVTGAVVSVERAEGTHALAPLLSSSALNDRVTTVFAPAAAPDRRVAVTQIAGWVARRVDQAMPAGTAAAAGEKLGMIHFGSRVDVEVPGPVAVRPGDRVRGPWTQIARLA